VEQPIPNKKSKHNKDHHPRLDIISIRFASVDWFKDKSGRNHGFSSSYRGFLEIVPSNAGNPAADMQPPARRIQDGKKSGGRADDLLPHI
jgi:hypothetical protein